MNRERGLLPHPGVSATLLVLWLWLNQTVAIGHVLLGLALGLALGRLLDPFLPPDRLRPRPVALARFLVRVLWDILVANVAVARRVLGPTSALRPAFVQVPLALEDPRAITLLASTVSLTPGTVSAEVSPDRRWLLVHALDSEDGEHLADYIKSRYERPIMELTGMIETAAVIALALLALALVLNTWRLLRGPDAVDRVLALDTLSINAVAMIVVYGVYLGREHLIEAALLIALLGFIGTVALCKFLLRGDIIE